MFMPWITLPAADVHVILPLGVFDKNIELMFRNLEAVDSAIEQLERIREMMLEKEKFDGRNG